MFSILRSFQTTTISSALSTEQNFMDGKTDADHAGLILPPRILGLGDEFFFEGTYIIDLGLTSADTFQYRMYLDNVVLFDSGAINLPAGPNNGMGRMIAARLIGNTGFMFTQYVSSAGLTVQLGDADGEGSPNTIDDLTLITGPISDTSSGGFISGDVPFDRSIAHTFKITGQFAGDPDTNSQALLQSAQVRIHQPSNGNIAGR